MKEKRLQLLKKVRKIEIKTRGLSDQLFSGGYQSAFKGRGMSFSEVREYQFGDDIRNIDWNVTARFDQPYIKVFEEERELTVMFLLDVSPSTLFGTQLAYDGSPIMKKDLMAEICAVLSFSAINNNDKVGVVYFTDEIEKFTPPKKGKNHILRIIRELVETDSKGNGTDIAAALRYLNNMLKKRSILFVISDFMDSSKDYIDELKIVNRRHDVVGIHIHDQTESTLPNVGLLQVRDAESNQLKWIDTSQKDTGKAQAEWYKKNLASAKEKFTKAGADFISISVKDSYIQSLLRLFRQREKRK